MIVSLWKLATNEFFLRRQGSLKCSCKEATSAGFIPEHMRVFRYFFPLKGVMIAAEIGLGVSV